MYETIISTRAIVEFGPNIALLRRASSGEFAGSWELPGGKLEEDETILDGLLREAKEETGLPLELSYFTPQLIEERTIPDGKHKNRPYRAFGAILTALSDDIILDPDEHIDHRWLTPQDAFDMNHLSLTSRNTLKVLGPLLCKPLIVGDPKIGRY